MEEVIELLHDCRLHDLSKENVLLSQLLGAEVLPVACGPLIVIEQVDEGRIGGLGEQLFIDIGEEPWASGQRPTESPVHIAETLPETST
jgi:hypothetical protein